MFIYSCLKILMGRSHAQNSRPSIHVETQYIFQTSGRLWRESAEILILLSALVKDSDLTLERKLAQTLCFK